MKFYYPLLAIVLFSCGGGKEEKLTTGDSNQVKHPEFNIYYDMSDKVNDMTLLNTNTIIKEEENEFSRLNSANNFGFGFEFPSTKVYSPDAPFSPKISLKVRKQNMEDKVSLVLTCFYNDAAKQPFWASMDIDSTMLDTTNTWKEIIFDNSFNAAPDVINNSNVRIYTSFTGTGYVDVDDLKIVWE